LTEHGVYRDTIVSSYAQQIFVYTATLCFTAHHSETAARSGRCSSDCTLGFEAIRLPAPAGPAVHQQTFPGVFYDHRLSELAAANSPDQQFSVSF